MSGNIFDDRNVNCCEKEDKNSNRSPLKNNAALALDNILAETLISEKMKPRQNILASLEQKENYDPYSEFSFEENTEISSPSQRAELLHERCTPVSSKNGRNAGSLAYSLSKRRQLLRKYTPKSTKKSKNSEDEYLPCPPRKPRQTLTPHSGFSLNSSQLDDSTPRRPNLRPRKRTWIDEDDIPLSALRDALIYHKIDREEKLAAEGTASKKKKRNSNSSSPKITPVNSSVPQLSKSSRIAPQQGKSRRKLRFSESDDEGLAEWVERLKTEKKAYSSHNNESLSDISSSSLENKITENEQQNANKIVPDTDNQTLPVVIS